MAYKEKVWNANVLTDLLSTYLTHKSGEREKYYQAEVTANKPQYKTVDGNLLRIDPSSGGIETIYSKPREQKEPKFEDFYTGDTVNKGRFMGSDYVQSEEDKKVGMGKGYRFTGSSKPQYKPDDPKAEEKKIEQKNISSMVSEASRLNKLKDGKSDLMTQMMISQGLKPPVFTEENQKQLDFYEKELASRGFDIYGIKTKTQAGKTKRTTQEELEPLYTKLIGDWTSKDYRTYGRSFTPPISASEMKTRLNERGFPMPKPMPPIEDLERLGGNNGGKGSFFTKD